MQKLHFVFMNGTEEIREIDEPSESFILRKEDIPSGVRHIDVMPEFFTAKTGEDGFLLIPSIEGSHYSALTCFKPREDCEEIFPESSMTFYAYRRGTRAVMAIVSGMRYEYSLVIGVRDGGYYLYPRFVLEGAGAYEDIEIRFVHFHGNTRYPEMARAYRDFQLSCGACRTLREKAAERPILKEYADTVECRIRLAWKPVPSMVEDQIVGVNEPPVHAELTFRDVDDIISEFHEQGIDKVNFCLVGWNAGGHDGRFPDLFPVEPKCGTVEELKALVEKTKSLGYFITAHTNLYEGYSVAKRFDHEYVLKKSDGSDHRGDNWGGGKSYLLCPKAAYERYLDLDMEAMKKLGFRGEHYFDVFSIVPPFPCAHPDHKLNRKEIAEWRCRIMKKARDAMGCVGSEGAWDFAAGVIDYALYMAFFFKEKAVHPMCDEYIPVWNLVYHGITLYNSFAASVNANIKSDRVLKVMNYALGGRPLNYVNSRFKADVNPWGNEDLRYHPVEQFRKDVTTIRKDYDFYRTIRHLQYEFIEDFEALPNGVLKTTYSNGEIMLSNPTDAEQEAEGRKLEPFSNVMVGGTAKN